MSSISIPEALRSVSTMIREGNFPAAREEFTRRLHGIDERDQAVILHCARLLEDYPVIGTTKLRQYWKTADERARAIIAACAPADGEQRQRTRPAPNRAPRWNRRHLYQAPSTVSVRAGTPRRPKTRKEIRAERVTEQYQHERAGIDDVPTPPDEPVWGNTDQDQHLLQPLRGMGCVALGCNLELTDADHRQRDWLCFECRELNRPGIDPLPAKHTRADVIQRICAYIWANYPRRTDRLRSLWRRLDSPEDRATLATWVTTHTPTDDTPTDPGTCTACRTRRTPRDLRRISVDDGQCTHCRSEATNHDTPTLTAA